jgi:hypothetical protein
VLIPLNSGNIHTEFYEAVFVICDIFKPLCCFFHILLSQLPESQKNIFIFKEKQNRLQPEGTQRFPSLSFCKIII